MEKIQDTIQAVLSALKSKARGGSAQEKAYKAFQKALTKAERAHIKCISLRNDMLVVNVDSSAWLYQLSFKKNVLTKKSGVSNIHFRIGEIK